MSEAQGTQLISLKQEVETPMSEGEEKIVSTGPIAPGAVETDKVVEQSEEEDPKSAKPESLENSKSCDEDANNSERLESPKSLEDNGVFGSPPTTKILERTKPGECNSLLPVLVERLRTALEQSCSSRRIDDHPVPLEHSRLDSVEDDLGKSLNSIVASNSSDAQLHDETDTSRGLKLDLKFLENLLVSDIHTALGRLQETLQRVDIVTLTRYSSTLDSNNKLNLLKLISSLLANLKIPEDAATPEKSSNVTSSPVRRKRADRHTIGVSAEEIARARKWMEEKNSQSPSQVDSSPEVSPPIDLQIQERNQDKSLNSTKEKNLEKYDKIREKSMKDAINQQQSLQSKSKDSIRENGFREAPAAPKSTETCYKDDNAIINEEYGISASSLYHQSNAQAKCNKFLAKKSKIKRANTIDIPNYLKLQAESLANSRNGCVSLRRPINIGDKYANFIAGNAVPSFEPKTENDRKFLALISKNHEVASAPPSGNLPFKSFNYRQTIADKNWNNRFSNIKTTFDKPATNSPEDRASKNSNGVVVGSLKLCYNGRENKIGFSHAPTSPFQTIEKPIKEETTTPGFLKPGYMSKASSGGLKAKVKLFDQENASPPISPQPIRPRAKQSSSKRNSNIFDTAENRSSQSAENGHLNYHSFCKQFAPFATKNPSDIQKSNPWTNGRIAKNPTKTAPVRDNFPTTKEVSYTEENNKVPVAFRTDPGGKSDRKPRNRKFYETYNGHSEPNGVANSHQVVAYPFEVNYQKRPNFGKKNRDESSEKGDYEDPEDRRASLTSLQFIKSVLPSARNPSPPPRGISSTQSVAVQTNQSEVPRGCWNENKNSVNPRRPIPPPLPMEILIRKQASTADSRGTSRNYADSSAESYKRENDPADYEAQGHRNLPQSSPQVNYPSLSDNYDYYPELGEKHYSLNSYGQTAPRIPVRSNPPSKLNPSSLKIHPESVDVFPRIDKNHYDEFDDPGNDNFGDYDPTNFYHGNKNPIYVPPFENPSNPPARIIAEDSRSCDDQESGDISEDQRSFVDDENIQNQDISSTDGVVTRYACAIATVSSASQSPAVSPSPLSVKDQPGVSRDPTIFSDKSAHRDLKPEILSLDEIRRHNLLQQNLIRQLQGEKCGLKDSRRISQESSPDYLGKWEDESPPMSTKDLRQLSQETILRHDGNSFNHPVNPIEDQRRLHQEPVYADEKSRLIYPRKFLEDHHHHHPKLPIETGRSPQESISRDENSHKNYSPKFTEDHRPIIPREIRRLSLEKPRLAEKLPIIPSNPVKILQDNRPKFSKEICRSSQESVHRDSANYSASSLEDPTISETIIESNNTQDKINIFEGRNNSIRRQQQHQFSPLNIPRESFVPPKINVVSPSKVFKPSFNSDGPRAQNSSIPAKTSSPVDSSDEYLMSCASKPSRSIVLSKSESWHQLALSKSTLQVPQQHQPCALLKPPKPKSPSSLRLSKQYEASSSSDNIRRMEDKIQRYFQGSSGVPPESPTSARREAKSKRNLVSKKSQGSLMRSHTMPHIYDEASDVEKAFDSLFKEATRSENRY